MSQLHQLIPLSDEMRGAQFTAFLGGPVPEGVRLGRYPTADELRAAFDRLDEPVRQMVQDKSGKSWSLAVMDGADEVLRIDARLRGQTEMLFTVSGDRHLLEGDAPRGQAVRRQRRLHRLKQLQVRVLHRQCRQGLRRQEPLYAGLLRSGRRLRARRPPRGRC